MKQKLKMASGYLLAGVLSCSVLVAAAKCGDGGCPQQAQPAASQPAASQSTGETQSAVSGEATEQVQTTGRKRRRSRKAKLDGEE